MIIRPVPIAIIGSLIVMLGIAVLLMPKSENGPSTPPVTLSEATDAVRSGSNLTVAERTRLRLEADNGNPIAMNNLAVAIWRDRGDREEMQHLFEKAAAAGVVPARYNLALILPDKFDTDPEIIRKRLALLEDNVAEGDVPSMVLLARSLRYVNRDAFVPNRENRIRSLLAQAAETGDPDYLVTYGKTLWNHLRGGADPALINVALVALQSAYDKGAPRGAETIGGIFARAAPDVLGAVSQDWTERDPLIWYRRAGDMGLSTARCHFGLELFRTGDWVRNPDMSLIERHFRAGPAILGNAPEAVAQAITDLEHCATKPRRKRRPNLPFGEPALHANKLRGTWTSMSTQPGWANMTLGVLYGYGIGVERNRARALEFLTIAEEREDFKLAAEVKSALPDF